MTTDGRSPVHRKPVPDVGGLIGALSDVIAACDRLQAAGRLHDDLSQREIAMLRDQLCILLRSRHVAPDRVDTAAAMCDRLRRRAATAKREAETARHSAKWNRARARQLRRHALALRSTSPQPTPPRPAISDR